MFNWLGEQLEVGSWVYCCIKRNHICSSNVGIIKRINRDRAWMEWKFQLNSITEKIVELESYIHDEPINNLILIKSKTKNRLERYSIILEEFENLYPKPSKEDYKDGPLDQYPFYNDPSYLNWTERDGFHTYSRDIYEWNKKRDSYIKEHFTAIIV